MEDKVIKKIVENINEEERLILEEEIFFENKIPNLDEEKISKIKFKSIEKLNLLENHKKNYKNIIKNTCAAIAIIVFIFPVIMLLIENSYSYTPEVNNLGLIEGGYFVLDKSISKEIDEQNLELKSFIWSNNEDMIYITVEGDGTNKIVDGIISVNDKNIHSNSYAISNSSEKWSLGQRFFTDIDYNEGDNIRYIIRQSDGKEVEFDLNLVMPEGDVDYKKLGPNNIKEGIAIIGIINEAENLLDIKFGSVVEGKEANVVCYGNEFRADEYDSGIILKDSKGSIVKAKEVNSEDKTYHFEFDTTDLVKPYSVIIPKVTLEVNNTSNKYEVIKVKLPKEGSNQINKEIKLSGSNYIGMFNNKIVNITNINKVGNNSYELNLDFPQNKDNKINISSVSMIPVSSIWKPKNDFDGYSESLDANSILKKIIIEPKNNEDTLRFILQPNHYIVEGNWVLDVN